MKNKTDPIAKRLNDPLFRPKVEPSGKGKGSYKRKKKHKHQDVD